MGRRLLVGRLHHTGDMRRGWENIASTVAPGGRLFISIYNDQGPMSRVWTAVKRTYRRVPPSLRAAYVIAAMAPRESLSLIADGPSAYFGGWRDYKRNRGMSRWHDLVDWVGGWPFEVATPEQVFYTSTASASTSSGCSPAAGASVATSSCSGAGTTADVVAKQRIDCPLEPFPQTD